ncbi:hypothetical protein SAMN05444388_102443 [Flavobacterium johnsoniae]|uniref:Uncharacterized protein n=1 Tax=Flavobacterium johnsoniae TaxID=986 RepID=A0A1M5JA68_FLAJO|nr:hypothetical protein SAMN05444388_102443 [Flavobacterium johnsoniae]
MANHQLTYSPVYRKQDHPAFCQSINLNKSKNPFISKNKRICIFWVKLKVFIFLYSIAFPDILLFLFQPELISHKARLLYLKD